MRIPYSHPQSSGWSQLSGLWGQGKESLSLASPPGGEGVAWLWSPKGSTSVRLAYPQG